MTFLCKPSKYVKWELYFFRELPFLDIRYNWQLKFEKRPDANGSFCSFVFVPVFFFLTYDNYTLFSEARKNKQEKTKPKQARSKHIRKSQL